MLSSINQDSVVRNWVIVGMLLLAFVAVIYISPVYKALGDTIVLWAYDVTVIIIVGITVWLMVQIARSFDRSEMLWRVWILLAIGMFLWLVGELIWAYYDLIAKEELPYPSLADVAWLAGYVPLITGLMLRLISLRTLPTGRQLVPVTVVFLLIVVIGGIFVIEPIVMDDTYENRSTQVIDLLYPIGDLAVAFAALLSVLVLAGGMLSYPWLVLALGFLVTAVSDLLYSYATWHEIYLTGLGQGTNLATAVGDVLYLAGYLLIFWGIIMRARLRQLI